MVNLVLIFRHQKIFIEAITLASAEASGVQEDEENEHEEILKFLALTSGEKSQVCRQSFDFFRRQDHTSQDLVLSLS